jgi:hypothetical protein
MSGMTISDSLALGIVIFSILLAVLVAALLFARVRPAPGDEPLRHPSRYIDPVLLVSALVVVLLALAVWWLR